LAAVLDESGDSTKAVAECARCLELEPSSGDCHFQLAVSLAKQGQVARAMTEAQRAMQLLPESPRVYDLLGALDRELHHDREAIDAARDALAVSPFDADLHYRAGLAAGQAGDFAMAAAQFAYAVLLNPKKPEHGERLRVALSFLKQSPDGQNVIRDLQSLASGSPKLLEILKPYAENSDPGMEYRQ
jgi:Flp pilus assembly protein TadD